VPSSLSEDANQALRSYAQVAGEPDPRTRLGV
jgi:hypothetical protein